MICRYNVKNDVNQNKKQGEDDISENNDIDRFDCIIIYLFIY